MAIILNEPAHRKQVYFAILITSLGYFIDVYDIILFNTIRIPSLVSLGVSGTDLTDIGLQLINMQLIGMLIGGIAWGILGDKLGRLSVLFSSILIYSTATLANAFVADIQTYAILRFIAGFGLAGELGLGVTLISEIMPPEKRGYGTMIIVTAGALGSLFGGLVSHYFEWQTAYIIGGIGGLILLLLRIKLVESNIYKSISAKESITRGSLTQLIVSKALRMKYLQCLLVGLPFWIFAGMFVTLAPEIAEALKITKTVTASYAILFWSIGLAIGNILTALLSQKLQSRRKPIILFLSLTLITVTLLLMSKQISIYIFYGFYAVIGIGCGTWSVFNMITAEQFGTNLRATAATSLPNFVRGILIPLVAFFSIIKNHTGILLGLGLISTIIIISAILATLSLKETFGKTLTFNE